jgi:hypothetical protein
VKLLKKGMKAALPGPACRHAMVTYFTVSADKISHFLVSQRSIYVKFRKLLGKMKNWAKNGPEV